MPTYGFGLDTFQAGLVLVPFSAAGFLAGRAVPRVAARTRADRVAAVSAVLVAAGFAILVLGRASVAGPVLAVTVLGIGVGGFSAAMPAMILAVTPPEGTAEAMGVNQVVRSVGFAVGSALGGLVLSAHAGTSGFPTQHGYTVAAVGGAIVALVSALVVGSARERERDPR